MSVKILLGQLNNYGDCLLATTIARQIKVDYPGCHLTWAISSICIDIVHNNPDIDHIWEIPMTSFSQAVIIESWTNFLKEVDICKMKGEYDLIFHTQYSYGRLENYMGITRASIFAGYPNKISVPIKPVINLTKSEITNVHSFFEKMELHLYKKIFLFECTTNSGQTYVNQEFLHQFVSLFKINFPDYALILSSNNRLNLCEKNIIDGSELSFRENAAALNLCDFFIGCSSGITWLSMSEGIKKIPKLILLSKSFPQASVVLDHTYFGISQKNIFEILESTPKTLINLISDNLIYFKAIKEAKSSFSYFHICFLNPLLFQINVGNTYLVKKLFYKANLYFKFLICIYLIKHKKLPQFLSSFNLFNS